MTLRITSSKIIFIAFIAISLMVALSVTTIVGSAAGFTECSDNYDNNFNGLIDEDDPACHTDWNASNSSSYDPNINAEHGSAPAGGGSGTWGDGCPGGCSEPEPAPQCDDGRDNDNDGFVDYPEDPSCSSYNDNREAPKDYPVAPQCNDGRDNDEDGYVDYPADPSCSNFNDNTEAPYDHPVNPPTNTLSVSCDVSDTRIEEGDRVTYEVDISGGRAPYTMGWRRQRR